MGMKKIILLIALLVTALPTIAQMKLEVTNQNDTVLCMEEISDSSWTVTLPNEKVEDRFLFLLTAAIGNEHFAFAYNMARGNIYRLSNGEHVRNVFGERTFFDQFEGIAIDPSSAAADTLGTGYYAHANEIVGMTKRNFFVHLDFATNDTIEVFNVEEQNIRIPWFGNDTIVYGNGHTNDYAGLWAEYDFSSIGKIHEYHQFGKSYLYIAIENNNRYILNTSNGNLKHITMLTFNGAEYPAKHLVGFGPRHLAIVTKQDEKLQLIFFRLTTINI